MAMKIWNAIIISGEWLSIWKQGRVVSSSRQLARSTSFMAVLPSCLEWHPHISIKIIDKVLQLHVCLLLSSLTTAVDIPIYYSHLGALPTEIVCIIKYYTSVLYCPYTVFHTVDYRRLHSGSSEVERTMGNLALWARQQGWTELLQGWAVFLPSRRQLVKFYVSNHRFRIILVSFESMGHGF